MLALTTYLGNVTANLIKPSITSPCSTRTLLLLYMCILHVNDQDVG